MEKVDFDYFFALYCFNFVSSVEPGQIINNVDTNDFVVVVVLYILFFALDDRPYERE